MVTTRAQESLRGGLQQLPLVYTGYAPLIKGSLLFTLLQTYGPQALGAGGRAWILRLTHLEKRW